MLAQPIGELARRDAEQGRCLDLNTPHFAECPKDLLSFGIP
jgi:hypothetical protein